MLWAGGAQLGFEWVMLWAGEAQLGFGWVMLCPQSHCQSRSQHPAHPMGLPITLDGKTAADQAGRVIQCLLSQWLMRRGGAGLSSPGQMQDRSRQGPPAGSASPARLAARGNLPVVQHAGALQGSSWLLRHL